MDLERDFDLGLERERDRVMERERDSALITDVSSATWAWTSANKEQQCKRKIRCIKIRNRRIKRLLGSVVDFLHSISVHWTPYRHLLDDPILFALPPPLKTAIILCCELHAFLHTKLIHPNSE